MPDSNHYLVPHMLPADSPGLLLRPTKGLTRLPNKPRGNMDAHLIGIDLAQLLLKRSAGMERRRSVKSAQPASESAIGPKAACAEPR